MFDHPLLNEQTHFSCFRHLFVFPDFLSLCFVCVWPIFYFYFYFGLSKSNIFGRGHFWAAVLLFIILASSLLSLSTHYPRPCLALPCLNCCQQQPSATSHLALAAVPDVFINVWKIHTQPKRENEVYMYIHI